MRSLNILTPAALVLAGTLLAGCGDKSSSAPQTQAQTQSTNPADINNPLVNAKRTADQVIDGSALTAALQLFNVQEGRYPKTLDELVPKYVGKLPEPPLGYQINYDPAKGEVTVVRQ
jgi:outer membrane murein-binding lipoprotein Lpp